VGLWKISRVLAGPLGQAASAAPSCIGQLACRRWDRAVRGERREMMMGLKREKQKQRGLGEKGARNHASQGQIKNI
jgi:hypothetical protein